MRINTLLIGILFIGLTTISAQDLEWTGKWKIWQVSPAYRTAKCCIPDGITIRKRPEDHTYMDLYLHFPEVNTACPQFHGTSLVTEKIIAGRFEDQNPTSVLKGFKGQFFPNNNTIKIFPGPLGPCAMLLGSNDSRITNDTQSNSLIPWDGAWEISAYYKASPIASCCVPLEPLVFAEDKKTLTLLYSIFFPLQPECPVALNGKSVLIQASVMGGSYVVPEYKTTGYYLQNNSIMVNSNDCIFILNKRLKTFYGEVTYVLGQIFAL